MEWLSNEMLTKAYLQAKELHLDKDFLDLIEEEMGKRSLDIYKVSQERIYQ